MDFPPLGKATAECDAGDVFIWDFWRQNIIVPLVQAGGGLSCAQG